MASADHPSDGSWAGYRCNHGIDGQVEDVGVALARAVHGEGVEGLLRDKARRPGIAPLEKTLVDQVVALILEPPVQEATQMDGARDGRGGGLRGVLGREDLGRPRAGATPLAQLQALQ